MKRRFYLISTLMLLLPLGAVTSFGQVDKSMKKQKLPIYRSAGSEHTVGERKVLLLFISIDLKHLNREDMKALAGKLRCDFPKEKQIQVNIFTNHHSAKTSSINPGSKGYAHNMKAFRGGYYLNRETGEEYVSFSPSQKASFNEEKIDLSKEGSKQCLLP
jgi:hypothetical protein